MEQNPNAAAAEVPKHLPQLCTSQWNYVTADAVIWILTQTSPDTPVKSLCPDGIVDADTIAQMMIESMTMLHTPQEIF